MVSRGKKVGSTPESRVAISDVLLNRRKSSEGHQRGAMEGDLSIFNKGAGKRVSNMSGNLAEFGQGDQGRDSSMISMWRKRTMSLLS